MHALHIVATHLSHLFLICIRNRGFFTRGFRKVDDGLIVISVTMPQASSVRIIGVQADTPQRTWGPYVLIV